MDDFLFVAFTCPTLISDRVMLLMNSSKTSIASISNTASTNTFPYGSAMKQDCYLK